MPTCKTRVLTGLDTPKFKDCGLPAEVSIYVGKHLCHFCKDHAKSAINFVMTHDTQTLLKIQNQESAGI